MAIADKFPPFSFGEIALPYSEYSVKGALNHHVHVALHMPGGSVENLQRRLYEIRVRCPFHEMLRAHPRAYPERLAVLRAMFEIGTTRALVIPSIGSIPAKCIEWEQRFAAKIRSGEDVNLVFLEDRSATFLIENLIATSTATLGSLATRLPIEAGNAGLETSLFDDILGAVNGVLALKDTADIYASIIDAKLQSVMRLVQDVDNLVTELGNPSSWAVADILREIFDAARTLRNDVLGQSVPMDLFEVTMLMTISQVSQAIYGTTARAGELLTINDLDDALRIRAGTKIRHYVA